MFLQSSKQKKEKGQGLVEYALILVLVAIVVIAVLMVLGPIIGNVFSTVNSSLSSVSSGSSTVPMQGGLVLDCAALGAAPGQTIYYDHINGTVSTSYGDGLTSGVCE